VQFTEKSHNRKLNGEQCARFVKNASVVINTLYSDPAYADDREQWTQVMEEWDFLSSMLKCQEIEKIENLNFEIALTLPVRLRTLMLNISSYRSGWRSYFDAVILLPLAPCWAHWPTILRPFGTIWDPSWITEHQ